MSEITATHSKGVKAAVDHFLQNARGQWLWSTFYKLKSFFTVAEIFCARGFWQLKFTDNDFFHLHDSIHSWPTFGMCGRRKRLPVWKHKRISLHKTWNRNLLTVEIGNRIIWFFSLLCWMWQKKFEGSEHIESIHIFFTLRQTTINQLTKLLWGTREKSLVIFHLFFLCHPYKFYTLTAEKKYEKFFSDLS